MSTLPPPSTLPARKGLYRKGFVPDPAGHMATGAQHFLGAISSSLPLKANLRDYTEAIGNQGESSSCVGWATKRAAYTSLRAKGILVPLLSPLSIYTPARGLDREPDAQGDLPPLEDIGSMPNQAMRSIGEYGIASLEAWPFIEAKVNDEPTLGQLEAASAVKLKGAYLVKDASFEARLARIKQSIALAKTAVCVATDVDDAFEENTGGVIHALTGEDLGGHYVCVTGYEVVGGKTYLEFANSWTTSWGDHGYGRGDESWAHRLQAIYLLNVSPST